MSRETYEEYLRRPGRELSRRRIHAFAEHVRTCPTCSRSEYAYTACPTGTQLARDANNPALDKSPLRGAESTRSGDDKE